MVRTHHILIIGKLYRRGGIDVRTETLSDSVLLQGFIANMLTLLALFMQKANVEGAEISGGVFHCYVSEYDCRSSCSYNCQWVESCEYDLSRNYICLPNIIWLIAMTMIPSACLLLFLCLICCCCSQNCYLIRWCDSWGKRRRTNPIMPQGHDGQSATRA